MAERHRLILATVDYQSWLFYLLEHLRSHSVASIVEGTLAGGMSAVEMGDLFDAPWGEFPQSVIGVMRGEDRQGLARHGAR